VEAGGQGYPPDRAGTAGRKVKPGLKENDLRAGALKRAAKMTQEYG